LLRAGEIGDIRGIEHGGTEDTEDRGSGRRDIQSDFKVVNVSTYYSYVYLL
jgi:hypothetical protein